MLDHPKFVKSDDLTNCLKTIRDFDVENPTVLKLDCLERMCTSLDKYTTFITISFIDLYSHIIKATKNVVVSYKHVGNQEHTWFFLNDYIYYGPNNSNYDYENTTDYDYEDSYDSDDSDDSYDSDDFDDDIDIRDLGYANPEQAMVLYDPRVAILADILNPDQFGRSDTN